MGIQGVMFKGLECGVQALLLQGLLGRTLTASKVGHIFWHPPHARFWEQVCKFAGILGATAYEASLMVNSGDCLFKTEAADPQNGFSHAPLTTQTSALPAWALGFPRERLLWPSACS